MTQNFKSNTKITYVFFETLFCLIHHRSSRYSRLILHSLIYVKNNSNLVKLNFYHFEMFINT